MSNESQNPLNKRQRLEIPKPLDQSNELLLLLDQPPLARNIISFLNLPDRLNLAETCHLAKKQVDTYCEKVLEEITGHNNCNVDGTFHERIRNQTSIITSRTKPVHLPPRYLLWVALRREPLYNIQLYDEDCNGEYKVILSPSQNRIFVSPLVDRYHFYDLQARQRLTTLHCPDFIDEMGFLDDTSVIVRSEQDDKFYGWSHHSDEDGNHNWTARNLYQVDGNAEILGNCFRIDQHHVLFSTTTDRSGTGAARNEPRLVFQNLDTRSSTVDTILTIKRQDGDFAGRRITDIKIAGSVNQKWLLFFCETTDAGEFQSGLYIYDLQTKSKILVWRGGYGRCCWVHHSFASPETFCAIEVNDGSYRASILQLNPQNGQLSALASFLVGQDRKNFGFSDSHVYFTKYDGDQARGKVEAFNLQTWKEEWSIYVRSDIELDGGVAFSQNELIVVVYHEGGNVGINAFCLKEPQL